MGFVIQSGDIRYQGSFRLPQGTFGSSQFGYGGRRAGYSKERNTLIIAGHTNEGAIAEVSIPVLKTGAITGLNTATLVQNFRTIIGAVPNNSLSGVNGEKIGGIYPYNGKVYGGAYRYYDGAGDAVDSQWIINGTGLTSALSGYYPVGPFGGGFYGGWITEIPTEHTGAFGRKHMVGLAAVAVVSRTSWGPAVHGINIDSVGRSPTPSAIPYLYYDEAHAISGWDSQPTNVVWNLTTEMAGAVFPTGSDSILFFGSHGTGAYCYGCGGDTARPDSTPHAQPYFYQIWAYHASGLLKSRSGISNPWDSAPYGIWRFPQPYQNDAAYAGGIAYDPTGNRIFWLQIGEDGDFSEYPVVNVFSIQSTGGGGSGTPTNHSGSFDDTLLFNSQVRASGNLKLNSYSNSNFNTSLSVNVTSPDPSNSGHPGFSKYICSGILSHLFRSNTLTKPNLWLTLSINSIYRTGVGINEIPHTGGYIRTQVTGNACWSTPIYSGGRNYIYNNTGITLSNIPSTYPVSGWAILDASGYQAGNIISMGRITKSLYYRDQIFFPPSGLRISFG